MPIETRLRSESKEDKMRVKPWIDCRLSGPERDKVKSALKSDLNDKYALWREIDLLQELTLIALDALKEKWSVWHQMTQEHIDSECPRFKSLKSAVKYFSEEIWPKPTAVTSKEPPSIASITD